jgi:hypothetical protein
VERAATDPVMDDPVRGGPVSGGSVMGGSVMGGSVMGDSVMTGSAIEVGGSSTNGGRTNGGPATAVDLTRAEPSAALEAVPVRRSRADRFARWALRVRDPVNGQEVHNIFSASMALSGTRCLLSYIVLPILAPWLGAVPFIGPAIGIPVGILALVFDVRAMRRFFQSDHRWRWVAAIVYLAVMAMVASLVFRDISHLV